MSESKIAIVTGANRGLGFEITRQLAKLGIQVILTSRDEEKGYQACDQLHQEGLDVLYHQLDVTKEESINELCEDMSRIYQRCDILINNAGIFPDAPDASDSEFHGVFTADIETIQSAMLTNVYGPLLLCQGLVPLMEENNYGRIVNLSSTLGQLKDMGGGMPAYRMSKTALNALTRMVAAEVKDYNILVNSMCPGWCRTDMGGPNANRSVEEGAETAVYLATLSNDGPRGRFIKEKNEFDW